MLAINQKYHKIHSIVIHYRKKMYLHKNQISIVAYYSPNLTVLLLQQLINTSHLFLAELSTWSLLISLHQIILARQLRDNSKCLSDPVRILCQFNRLKHRLFVNISQYTEVTKPSFYCLLFKGKPQLSS